MNQTIRNAKNIDLPAVLTINESVVPHVNSLVLDDMAEFLNKAAYFRVCCDKSGQVLAFLIGLAPGTDYDSPNYQWFSRRYKDFAYVDRIAVASTARRQGIADALYSDFATVALGWTRRMTCEVNLRPENPGSLEFHRQQGFIQVGSQEIHGGAKKVALLLKELGKHPS